MYVYYISLHPQIVVFLSHSSRSDFWVKVTALSVNGSKPKITVSCIIYIYIYIFVSMHIKENISSKSHAHHENMTNSHEKTSYSLALVRQIHFVMQKKLGFLARSCPMVPLSTCNKSYGFEHTKTPKLSTSKFRGTAKSVGFSGTP